METLPFRKLDSNRWQGGAGYAQYAIVRRDHPDAYVLYYNGSWLASDPRLHPLKAEARRHAIERTVQETNE